MRGWMDDGGSSLWLVREGMENWWPRTVLLQESLDILTHLFVYDVPGTI